MANDVNVSPTPIQRNRRDVAIELVELYLKQGNFISDEMTEDRLCELYSKFHRQVVSCDKER